MSDLDRHDDEEYHFDDSETFDFGEHDATEEEFIGEEDVVEDTPNKEWSNSRSMATESAKKSLPIKKIGMGVGIVVLLIAGYFLMVPRGNPSETTEIPSATKTAPKVKPNQAAPAPAAAPASTAATNTDTTAAQPASAPAAPDTTAAANANTALDNDTSGAWLGNDNSASPAPSTQPATGDTSADTTTTTTPAGSSATDDNNLSMQVQTLNQENQALTLKLQAVTAQSEATAARANSLEKTLAQLQAQIKQMKQESSTPAPLQRPRSVAATSQSSTTPSTSKAALVYYVQAIIPGRAWIGDSNGRIITVTQGDRVEALNSTVKNIDPVNGIVTLSNGMQIEYGMVAQ